MVGFKFKSGRGGLRPNSSILHKSHKQKSYVCNWCDKPFTSNANNMKGERYCSTAHRTYMFKLKQSIDNKRRVTKKERKRHTFRPETWRTK